MSEKLTNNPNRYKEIADAVVKSGDREQLNRSLNSFREKQERQIVEAVETGKATHKDAKVAYDVAWAIKPDVDAVTGLQKRIQNPDAAASAVRLPDGEMGVMGREDVYALQLQKRGAEIDLENNTQRAVQAAQVLGQLAVRQ